MAKKTSYIVALAGIVLLCALISWGFKANQPTPSDQDISNSLQEQPRRVTSENANVFEHGALTKEEVSEFLDKLRRDIRSKDAKLRQQAISFILEERRENISMLLGGMLQDETLYRRKPNTVVDAMRLLGKMRAKEAVGILAEHIDFQAPGADFPSGRGGYYTERP